MSDIGLGYIYPVESHSYQILVANLAKLRSRLYCKKYVGLVPLEFIIKQHVHRFHDTDLHPVIYHFVTQEAVRPSVTDRVKINVKEPIQNVFICPTAN